MAEHWAELTPDEKRAERFRRWLSPEGVVFQSPEAEQAYRDRVTRLTRALHLQEPDRVPCILPVSNFPAYYAGTDLRTVMYEHEEMKRAWTKFLNDFDGDTYAAPGMIPPGRALEAVDYQLYRWPGHGISGNTTTYQCVEAEWMKADEYDALINDPSDFWLRTYLPRVFGAFKAFEKLPPLTSFEEMVGQSLMPFGLPEVQSGFQALLDAGRESMKWKDVTGEIIRVGLSAGFPGFTSGIAKAPFDTLGDTLRGTKGVIMDMFQRQDKLLEAMERIVPLTIASAIASADRNSAPLVFMPLHKGADAFMSLKQYETFYWPTLKKVVTALVNEGIMPVLFAEGSYNKRLEIIGDFPRASVVWYFDQTDIFRAKEVIGGNCCIMGNVPTSLLMTGQPQEVKEHCRKLIEVCGKGGGYILTGGARIDMGNPDNLRAMLEAAREYGVYK